MAGQMKSWTADPIASSTTMESLMAGLMLALMSGIKTAIIGMNEYIG